MFDAAAEFQKNSLNKNLLKGSEQRQICCHDGYWTNVSSCKGEECGQDALRFVWRNMPEKENEDHKMGVHIFGKIDSLCIANWVIK